MKRVVVTGMGIWSCIGQDLQTVTESLRQGRSGIIFDPKRIEYGLHSGLVGNVPRPDLKPLLPRKFRATMSEDAEYAYMAARQAFEQAGILDNFLCQNEVGVIWGSDNVIIEKVSSAKILHEEKSSFMLGPNALFSCETSSPSMNLSAIFHLKGINLSIGAACASSSHAIGLATTLIRENRQKIIIVGGSNETSPNLAMLYDCVGGLSRRNVAPSEASSPFDINVDGFVPSGGAAALVLEEYEHAKARGAHILAEVVGYGFSSDGTHILNRNYKQVVVAMKKALVDAQISAAQVDYLNPFAASNKYDSVCEAKALSEVFTNANTLISSTETFTGHEYDMSGAGHAVYTILMMQNNFVAPMVNLKDVFPEAQELNFVTKMQERDINITMSNSSGTGATNSSIIFMKI